MVEDVKSASDARHRVEMITLTLRSNLTAMQRQKLRAPPPRKSSEGKLRVPPGKYVWCQVHFSTLTQTPTPSESSPEVDFYQWNHAIIWK